MLGIVFQLFHNYIYLNPELFKYVKLTIFISNSPVLLSVLYLLYYDITVILPVYIYFNTSYTIINQILFKKKL
jgi:hypothetical protein